MIEAARALRDQAQARLDTIAAEADHLLAVVEALNSFMAAIDQPGQVRSAPAPEGSPAPASTSKRSLSGAASADRASGPADEESPAGGGSGGRRPTSAPAASSLAVCSAPGCGKPARHTGRHRTASPGVEPIARATAAEAKVNGPSRTEKYLCGRNCGQSFLSREYRDQHEVEGACRPKPTPPPTGREPLGPQGGTTRSGGLGQ